MSMNDEPWTASRHTETFVHTYLHERLFPWSASLTPQQRQSNSQKCGWKPWSSGYGRRLMLQRS